MTEPKTTRYESLERQRLGVRSGIRVLKELISIKDYLAAHGVEVKHSRARCIVHGGDNPQSFVLYPGEQRWHCFRCNEGGDLIDLCEMVERHADTWTAIISLAMQFNVELPQRPERWHTRQNEKERVRTAAKKHIARTYQRRLTRVYAPLVLAGETPEEGLRELEELATALWPVALDMAGKRVSGE